MALFYFSSPNLFAAQSMAMASNFYGDLSLIWLNQSNKPKFGLIDQGNLVETPSSKDSTSNSIGLKKARFVWDWSHGKKNGLTLVFRPDALSQETADGNLKQRNEIDQRLGDVVDESPSLRFLDAYQIHLIPLSALSVSFGVFEELTKGAGAYATDIPFGLEIIPVSKTLALLFSWVPEGGKSRNFGFDFAVYQGTNERGEQATTSKDSQNSVLRKLDDQKNGGLLATTFRPGSESEFLATISYHESKWNEFFDTSRAYAQIGVNRKIRFDKSSLLLSGDSKYTVDRYDRKISASIPATQPTPSTEGLEAKTKSIPDRIHRSVHFAALYQLVPEFFLLGSLDYGEAMLDPERIGQSAPPDNEVKAKGYQYEVGLKVSGDQGATAQLTYAVEGRHSEDFGGNHSGGFKNKDGTYRNSIPRFALNISYFFDSRL